MNENIEVPTAELPEAIRSWLDGRAAVVVSIERLDNGHVLIRELPDVAPDVLARAQVTMAKYREALMNLT